MDGSREDSGSTSVSDNDRGGNRQHHLPISTSVLF
jgi:hypothetical protein